MTDRELLEMAAKAAGIELRTIAIKPASGEGDGLIGYMVDPAVWPRGWFDPLDDDGDALRLAVKLEMAMKATLGESTAIAVSWQAIAREPHGTDPCAATRRAIVRAAAEIGRSMP